ncbi:ABC transporter substrate-binding protein [Nakamurella antarctica]|uniref:ABC transporter substrate-binding protein n=1 Tax=Nakamurella antarctica TaxID=1902245 RepID=A0A3G8ZNI9_9ACTN|nr:ABC transporter substrate-binding protein [Nakamurella antarctica]AZI58365.1 ABC transporter substrate-binding protein [Nakamurella antarctica]
MTLRITTTFPKPSTFVWRAAVAIAATVLAGCSSGAAGNPSASNPSSPSAAAGWDAVLAQARGQTVNWYMYGGDDVLNGFISGFLTTALAVDGVTLNQVKITDTKDAVNKVLGELQAGRTADGSVDAIWVNGVNFATGVQANMWDCGWTPTLPNARYVNFDDPAVANDFGTPVNGCEAVWQQANSALVYDSSALGASDVASVTSLLSWAAAHPGRFTYPALPDFTGSMAVRTILYDQLGGPAALAGSFNEQAYSSATQKLWPTLNQIEPSLWRGGSTYPQDQAAVEKLYAAGEISAFFTYGPGATGAQVADGVFPASTRTAVLSGGNIANRSFLAVPVNAAHRAAALVLANTLQAPATQLELLRATGTNPGIDLAKLDATDRAAFASVPTPASVLPVQELTKNTQPELAAQYIARIEKDWAVEVLQK